MDALRAMLFLSLFLGVDCLCMESNEENREEKSVHERRLEQFRKEKAAQHEQEKKEKESAYQKKMKEEQAVTSVVSGRQGKEEIEPSSSLTREEQAKLFATAKEAIVVEQKRIAQKPIEMKEKFGSEELLAFLIKHKSQLHDISFDQNILNQVVAWINNKLYISRPNFLKLLEQIKTMRLNNRILYALLHKFGFFLYNNLEDIKHFNWDFDPLIERQMETRNILSAQLLFTPFALSRADVLESYYKHLCSSVQPRYAEVQYLRDSLRRLDLCGNSISNELARLRLARAEHHDEDIGYLSITRNLDLIRIILFLAAYTSFMDFGMFKQFVGEHSSEITGNERTPDGMTALMFAVGGGYVGIVTELLRRGANPWLMNNYGDNALSIVAVQLHRAQLQHDSTLIKIYTRIQQLLEESPRRYVIRIAQLIRALQSERQETLPNGTAIVVPGLPYDLALRIALADFSTDDQRVILRLLNQLPEDRLIPLAATTPPNQQEAAAVPQTPGFSHYLPAWMRYYGPTS